MDTEVGGVASMFVACKDIVQQYVCHEKLKSFESKTLRRKKQRTYSIYFKRNVTLVRHCKKKIRADGGP